MTEEIPRYWPEPEPSNYLLTVNCGSSSLKLGFIREEDLVCRRVVDVERIGREGTTARITDHEGHEARLDLKDDFKFADHASALKKTLSSVTRAFQVKEYVAVGHRMVHGGPQYRDHARVTPEMLAELRRVTPFAPLHLPAAVSCIDQFNEIHPDLPQIACFDTAFHRTMPDVARLYALPERFAAEGLFRYGFHGLSFEYIVNELQRLNACQERVIVAHLGNGCSLAAVKDGVGIDTTMGFTPAAGLVMGTRAGDVDPGLLFYLLKERQMPVAELERALLLEGGLLGLSGVSNDMRQVLEREATDPRCALAAASFCHSASRHIGALTASLAGLDTLVFTGGIGEHAAEIRRRICEPLAYLGLEIDPALNSARPPQPIISTPSSRVCVRVMKTNEELMIARHTLRLK